MQEQGQIIKTCNVSIRKGREPGNKAIAHVQEHDKDKVNDEVKGQSTTAPLLCR